MSLNKFDKLDELWKIQEDLQNKLGTLNLIRQSEIKKQRFINQMILACHEEVTEIMRESAYKNPDFVEFGWKKGQKVDWNAFKDEIVDLMHFVINLSIAGGMGAEEFHARYLKKHKINKRRKEEGY